MMTVRSINPRPLRGSIRPEKLVQDFGDFVAAFATPDIDDDVGVAPFRQGFLQHGLAGAESAGNGGAAAARHREQRIEDALAGDHRLIGGQAFAYRPRLAHRPLMEKADLLPLACRGSHRAENFLRADMRLHSLYSRSSPPHPAGPDRAGAGRLAGPLRRRRRRSASRPSPSGAGKAVFRFAPILRAAAKDRRRCGRADRGQVVPKAGSHSR